MHTKGLHTGIVCYFVVCLAAGAVMGVGSTVCAYSKQRMIHSGGSEEGNGGDPPGELLEGGEAEQCRGTRFCYALWQEEEWNNSTLIAGQGCWSATESDCSKGACVSNKPPQSVYNISTHFCCCQGERCNANYSLGAYVFATSQPDGAPGAVESASPTPPPLVMVLAAMLSLCLVLGVGACFAWYLCSRGTRAGTKGEGALLAHSGPTPPMHPTQCLEKMKIAESIGRGRYGHVFRGTLASGQTVAVKIFSSQHRNNYLNERSVYLLPFMEHPCLPKLIGAEERLSDDRLEYLLVLQYAPLGCLQDYLSRETIDWARFCRMAQSVTQGLAHLHMEIRKEGKTKLCVVHRDLTSRNILIKVDGSCMLCDFGFAICVSGSKYYYDGEEQVAESTSLMDVGTLRYMAPEVLEGAVNLRDCESSLKQIDVYSLGLIMWELATRCTDLFQGIEVPEYKAPFVAEIGNHPTMEQLQVLVAKNKARPLFPDIWKDTNPAVRALKETIEDCWDQDAEARLTALCVEERLIELPILWDRHKAGTAIQGVSPTINPTSSQVRISSNGTVSSNGWCRGPAFEMPLMKAPGDAPSPTQWDSRNSGDFSVSENTAETSITLSPCDWTPRSSGNGYNFKNLATNNNVTLGMKVTVPLQPYQGKNPIMERNLIIEPIEDITVSGNSLVERGDKFSTRNNSTNSFNLDTDIFNTLQTNEVSESNALVPNDVLSHSTRAVNPIPYVQNAVHVVSTIPKKPNVPGNGHSLQMANGHGTMKEAKSLKEEKSIIVGFKNFFKFPRNSASIDPPLVVPVEPPTVNVPKLNTVPKPHGVTNLTKTQSMDTEVYIMDPDDEFSMTQTVVRPVANRQVYSQTVPCETVVKHTEANPVKKLPFQNGFVQSQTHPQLSAENNPKMKRPNTLPISRLENGTPSATALIPSPIKMSSGSESNVSCAGHSDQLNSDESKPSQSKNCRFSLYDDRIMTLNARLFRQIEPTSCKLGSPHISASVPLSIDSLCESEVSNFHQTFQTRGSQPRVNDNQ